MKSTLSTPYDESYYTTGNYEDYLTRQQEFRELAQDFEYLLKCLGQPMAKPILDFGCATGMLLDGFKELYIEGEGVDVSNWARYQAMKKGHIVHKKLPTKRSYSVTYALDVLEHLEEDELNNFLRHLQTEVLIFRVPTVLTGQKDYYIEEARNDPTHVIRWTDEQWKERIENHCYFIRKLYLPHIYCSAGAYCGIAFKL